MKPPASVLSNSYARPFWAPTPRAAAVVTALALALSLPGMAYAGTGGTPSPDPSSQIAPDPAPSGGEIGSHGAGGQAPRQQSTAPSSPSVTPSPSVAPAVPSSPTPAAAARAAASAHRRTHHHPAVSKRHKVHDAQTARLQRADPVRPLSTLFVSSLRPALHAPGLAPAAGAQDGPGDALVLASLALLLLVVTGLMTVRTSAQVLRRERPA